MTSLSDADLLKLLQFTIDLARQGGEVIRQGSSAIKASQAVNQKKNAGSFSTRYMRFPNEHNGDRMLCLLSLLRAVQ